MKLPQIDLIRNHLVYSILSEISDKYETLTSFAEINHFEISEVESFSSLICFTNSFIPMNSFEKIIMSLNVSKSTYDIWKSQYSMILNSYLKH